MEKRTVPLLSSALGLARPRRCALSSGVTGIHVDADRAQTDVIDVLSVGNEATALRPVQRALIGSGWVVRHLSDVRSAVRLLEKNPAAVAVVEGDATDWVDMLSSLRTVADPPELVVITHDDLPVEEVLSLGAHDLLRRPFSSADLLWSIATAWHAWMKQFERRKAADDHGTGVWR